MKLYKINMKVRGGAIIAALSIAMAIQTAFAEASRVYDVGDYVKEGLVVHFDGIRNAGADAAHDSAATTWVNLVPGGPNATLQTLTSDSLPDNATDGEWLDNAYSFKAKNYFQFGSLNLGHTATVQMAVDYTPVEKPNWPVFLGGVSKDDDKFIIYTYGTTYSQDDSNRLVCRALGYTTSINPWGGKAINFIYDGANSRISINNTSIYQWNPGGSGRIDACHTTFAIGTARKSDSHKDDRMLTGKVHNTRIYDRVLSEAELAWNQSVDDARYRSETVQNTDSVNVIIDSDICDLGAGWMGSYVVSGSQTFTAPKHMWAADGKYCTCTGYKLEIFDGIAWGAAENYPDRTVTINPEEGKKYRVVWQWKKCEVLRVYDTDDYVQTGLISHFDAIRNVGINADHNSAATTWKNLVGDTDVEFVFRPGRESDMPSWSVTSYSFDNDAMATTKDVLDLNTNFTVQIAITANPSEQVAGETVSEHKDVSNYNAWFNDNPKNDYGFWTKKAETSLIGNFQVFATAKIRPTISNWGGQYVTWMLDGMNKKCYTFETDTIPTGTDYTPNTTIHLPRKYCWGAEISSEGNLQAFVKAEYHNVRIYNQVLTDKEVAWNRQVDEARFRNPYTAGKTPNVIIASNIASVQGDIECGKYLAPAGFVFTAALTNTVAGSVLTGYTLETWDEANGVWSDPVTCALNTYTATGSGLVRLTWQWGGLRGAAAYDTCDYVQEGLVGHFDAIRNIGANLPHDTTTTTWKNLASGYPSAVFRYKNSYEESISGWTRNSYHFREDAMVTTTDGIDLGTNFTVQIAITASASEQSSKKGTNRYNAWFNDNPKNNRGFWTDRTGNSATARFSNFDSSVGDQKISNWDFRYANYIIDGANGKCYFFQGNNKGEGANIIPTVNPGALKYVWGGEYDSAGTNLQAFLTGEYHNVRMYNRVLTDEEIAQNRRVDDIRYRGIGDVTVVNGALGKTGTNGASSVADGAYNLDTGSWTFTAPSVRIASENGTYAPKLLVEDWNTDTQSWVARTAKPEFADSFLYQAGSGRVRLTWTWVKRVGLVVTFR